MIRSFTRLVIGGLATGYDGLRSRLAVWDAPPPGAPPAGAPGDVSEPAPAGESERDRLRFALIGAVFAAEAQAGRSLRAAGRAARLAGNLAELLGGPVYASRPLRPVRRQIDRLAERGRQEVEAWIDLGRVEDQASRDLARAALYERVDNAIGYLTANGEVQELVQSQSVGLVDEVIEEARERTVSADNFLESLVRSALRRPQRWELPEPAEAIKRQAETPRQLPGSVAKPSSRP